MITSADDLFAVRVNAMAKDVHALAKSKGWWDEPKAGGEDLCAMHGYLSYILESRRTKGSIKISAVDLLSMYEIATNWSSVTAERKHIPTLLALIHSEVSEAFEAAEDGIEKPSEKLPDFSEFELELADIVIRVFDMSAALGIDIGAAISAKHRFNSGRSHKHGGKKF